MYLTKFKTKNKKFIDYIHNPNNKIISNNTYRDEFIIALKTVSRNGDLLFRAKYTTNDSLTILQVWKDKHSRRKFEKMYEHEKIINNFPKEWKWEWQEEEINDLDFDKLKNKVSSYDNFIIQVNFKDKIFL